MRRLLIFLSALASIASASLETRASATAGASAAPPRLVAERGLVVWDPVLGREHLLVTAQLEAGAGPSALVLPIPLPPVVEPVSNELSAAVEKLIAAHSAQAEIEVAPWPSASGPAASSVLQAADAGSLGGFLERHALAAYPGLSAFARSYGERAYYYVALSLPKVEGKGERAPRVLPWTAVSFTTPRPFYPLATPAEVVSEPKARSLEVYTLSPELLALTAGDEFDSGKAVRISQEELARFFGDELLSAWNVEKALGAYWLQRFVPERTPIDGEDGFFVRIPEPSPRTLPTEITAPPPPKHASRLLAFALATAFAALVAWAGSREPSRPGSSSNS